MKGNMASMIIGAVGDALKGTSNSWKNAKLTDEAPSIVPDEANEGMNWANQLKLDGASGIAGASTKDVSIKGEGKGFSPKAFGDVSKLKFSMSDENTKEGVDKDVSSVGDELLQQMSNVKPFHFVYKPEFEELDDTGSIDGDPHIGVKAQDIEAQPLLNSIISENENGLKEIDIKELTLANTATISALINKLKELGVLDGNYR